MTVLLLDSPPPILLVFKNHVNFDVGDLFFRSPALWSSQNVFGPPTAGRVVVDFKDRACTCKPC